MYFRAVRIDFYFGRPKVAKVVASGARAVKIAFASGGGHPLFDPAYGGTKGPPVRSLISLALRSNWLKILIMKIVLFFLGLILIVRLLLFINLEGSFEYIADNTKAEIPVVSPLKDQITENVTRILPSDAAALLLGVVFGDKGNFNDEYLDAIRSTGVLHVIAASGMNVSMVAGVIFGSLVFFLSRPKALIAASLAIIVYTAFAEFEESIVRASIMAIFAFGAGLSGRQNTAVFALLIAAFIMIMWNPTIIGSIGFQLSFAATAGIILFEPIFKRFEKKKSGVVKAFIEDGRTTIAAQIATVPILIFYFETYSPISIIANFLILWTIPPIMILGAVASVVSLLAPILAVPILWLTLPLLEYFKVVVLFLNDFSVDIDVKNMPILVIAGYYMVILASILALWKHFRIRL